MAHCYFARQRIAARVLEAALAGTNVLCTGGAPGGAFARGAEAARRPNSGWRYRRVETGHHAMVTKPREVADLFLEVVLT